MARAGKGKTQKHPAIRAMKSYLDRRFMPLIRFENESRLEGQRSRRSTDRVGKLKARTREKKVRAFAQQRARENRARAAQLIPRFHDLPSPVGEPTLVFLTSAANVDHLIIGPISDGGAVDASWKNLQFSAGIPGRNLVTGKGTISAGKTQFGSLGLLTHWHFIWPSTRAGLLKASAWAAADVWYALKPMIPVLAGRTTSAAIEAEAWLSVGQYSPQVQFSAGTSITPLLGAKATNNALVDTAATIGSPFASEFLTVGPSPTPIVAGADVICTVSIRLEISALHGVVIVEFQDPLQLGAPVVLLNID